MGSLSRCIGQSCTVIQLYIRQQQLQPSQTTVSECVNSFAQHGSQLKANQNISERFAAVTHVVSRAAPAILRMSRMFA